MITFRIRYFKHFRNASFLSKQNSIFECLKFENLKMSFMLMVIFFVE